MEKSEEKKKYSFPYSIHVINIEYTNICINILYYTVIYIEYTHICINILYFKDRLSF